MPLIIPTGFYQPRGAFDPASSVAFSMSWVSNAGDASGTSPVTYSAMNFGAADPNRIIAAFICARENAPNSITSVTIGGVAATLVNSGGTTAVSQSTPNTNNGAIYQAAVPTGTSGNVVVTYGAAAVRSVVSLYRIITATPTATASGSGSNTVSGTQGLATTVPAGGAGFAGSWQGGSTASPITWTNATDDVQTNDPSANSRFSTATITGTGSITVTATQASANGSLFIWAAWGP